jgi:hypothetical protein
VNDNEAAADDELAAADARDWCPACGEILDATGVCPKAGTPGHLDEHGYLLR